MLTAVTCRFCPVGDIQQPGHRVFTSGTHSEPGGDPFMLANVYFDMFIIVALLALGYSAFGRSRQQ
jgi:hypothetical protein